MPKRQLEIKIIKLESQVKDLRKENRFLKQRNKELEQSRDLQKQKFKRLQTKKAPLSSPKKAKKTAIKRHK